MDIEVRYIERTCLKEKPYIQLIKKYIGLRTDKDIKIIFDLRLKKNYGTYYYDFDKRKHIISIMPYVRHKTTQTHEMYALIGTTMHELKHLIQREELGYKKFMSSKFNRNEQIVGSDGSSWFSECEIQARIYENSKVISAVEYYNACVAAQENVL